jgi:holin-like protein
MFIGNLLLLLFFLLVGEFLHQVMLVPLSGPLIGMTLLFLALAVRGGPTSGLEETARPLLACLALLFVPAGIGVIEHLDILARYWLPILVATVGGAAISLLVAAGTAIAVGTLMQRQQLRDRAPNQPEADLRANHAIRPR